MVTRPPPLLPGKDLLLVLRCGSFFLSNSRCFLFLSYSPGCITINKNQWDLGGKEGGEQWGGEGRERRGGEGRGAVRRRGEGGEERGGKGRGTVGREGRRGEERGGEGRGGSMHMYV